MTKSYEPEAIIAVLNRLVDGGSGAQACGCMGALGDQPRCPCAMSNVILWRGQWMEINPIKTAQDDYEERRLAEVMKRVLNPNRLP